MANEPSQIVIRFEGEDIEIPDGKWGLIGSQVARQPAAA